MDTALAVAITFLAVAMAYLGVRMSLHPPTESSRAVYKGAFIVLGGASVVLVCAQAQRNTSAQQKATDSLARIEKQNEQIQAQAAEIKRQSERPIEATLRMPGESAGDQERRSRLTSELQRLYQRGRALQEACTRQPMPDDIANDPVPRQAASWMAATKKFVKENFGSEEAVRLSDKEGLERTDPPATPLPGDRYSAWIEVDTATLRLERLMEGLRGVRAK